MNIYLLKFKKLKAYKSSLIFPNILYNITIGLILGDLCVSRRYNNSIAVLKFGQGISYVEYLLHLYELFDLYVGSLPKVYKINKNNKVYYQVNFQTLSFIFFDELRNLFYNEKGVKIIPLNIGDLLTPIGLGYWYMDDGNKLNSTFELHTENYTLKEVKLLINVLK